MGADGPTTLPLTEHTTGMSVFLVKTFVLLDMLVEPNLSDMCTDVPPGIDLVVLYPQMFKHPYIYSIFFLCGANYQIVQQPTTMLHPSLALLSALRVPQLYL